MDATIVSAAAAVMGSLVGGSATIVTAWFSQRNRDKRELLLLELPKREALYGEFITECSKLFLDALAHTIDDPIKLLSAYSLLNRIRLAGSPAVLNEAEEVLRHLTEQYFASNLTLDEMRELTRSDAADLLKPFGEACRAELLVLRGGI